MATKRNSKAKPRRESEDPQNKSNEGSGVVTSEAPPAPPGPTKSGTNDHDTTPKRKKWLEITGVSLGILVAVIYIFQLRAMQKQIALTEAAISNAQENFRIDESPVMWATPQKPIVEADHPILWDVRFTNYGKSSARNVRFCAAISFGVKLSDIPVPTRAQCEARPSPKTVTVFPQGYSQFTTIFSSVPVSKEGVDKINSTDAGAIVMGAIYYDDAFGHSYESMFCSARLTTGAVMSCDKYNDIKQTK
jgi:hypothetical protein